MSNASATHPDRPLTAPGIYKNLSYEAYQRIDAVNASSLKPWLISPRYAKWKEANPTDTEATKMGSAFHSFILDDDYHERFASLDDTSIVEEVLRLRPELVNVRNSKEYKAKYAEWAKLNEHKTLLKATEHETMMGCRRAFREHAETSRLNLSCTELSLVWLDLEFNCLCKARIDIFDEAEKELADLKLFAKRPTVRNIEYEIDDRGYAMQCAWYRRGVIALGMAKDPKVTLAFIQNTEEFDAAVVEVDSIMLEAGMHDAKRALALKQQHEANNKFPGVCPRRTQVSLTPRALARYEQELTEGGLS